VTTPLWTPSADRIAATELDAFRQDAERVAGHPLPDYDALWRWSIDDREAFWALVAEREGVLFHDEPTAVVDDAEAMPGARWFPGGTLNLAEHLLRATAARVLHDGTPDGAVRLVRETLASRGISVDRASMFNGSGLARQGRVPPRLITEVYRSALSDPKVAPDLVSSLAIWGVDGTARRHGRGDDNAGMVRVKTGSLDGVMALSGVVGCPSHPGFAFALLVNEASPAWRVRSVWSPFLAALSSHCPAP